MRNVTDYTPEDWRIIEASFGEFNYWLTQAQLYGIPAGSEYEFLRSVRLTFSAVMDLVNDLKGAIKNEYQ